MTTALHGLRVLEFAGLGAAPFAASLLEEAGADVIRIDRPPADSHGDRATLTLDLKDPADRGVAVRLAERADVLIEGFRPGVMERLGLGPGSLHPRNPGLVYGRMTGWGQDGPRAHEAGHDINYLAANGVLASIARRGERPVPPLNLVGDYGGGGLLLAFGLLLAIIERQRSGEGQVVDAAMVEGSSLLMTGIWKRRAQGRWCDEPGTNDIDTGSPFYDVYEARDGRHLAVGSIEPQFYARLLETLGLDPQMATRQWDRSTWASDKAAIAERFAERDRAAWINAFGDVDACVTPVNTLEEAIADPHIGARSGMIEVGGHLRPAPAPRLSRTPLDPKPARPALDRDRAEQLWRCSR